MKSLMFMKIFSLILSPQQMLFVCKTAPESYDSKQTKVRVSVIAKDRKQSSTSRLILSPFALVYLSRQAHDMLGMAASHCIFHFCNEFSSHSLPVSWTNKFLDFIQYFHNCKSHLHLRSTLGCTKLNIEVWPRLISKSMANEIDMRLGSLCLFAPPFYLSSRNISQFFLH